MFGCWTSVSRKSVLPVFEELNGLLFYPVQYEGEELSKNVFYTGAAPNQQAIPAVEYLMSKEGGGAKRFVLLGTDYVYPRTTNKILRAFLKSKGVQDKDIDEKYTPFGHSDYQTIVADIKKFAAGGKTAVVSTINGDSNVPFYKELGNQGLKATDVPVVAFSVGEEELRGVDTKPLVGHLAAWNYFMSLKNPANDAFKKQWAAYAKAKKLPGRRQAAHQRPDGSHLHRHPHVEAGGREGQVDRRRQGRSRRWPARPSRRPSGFTSKMDEKNHHLHKPVFIGEVQADGQFNVVWKTKGPIQRAALEPVHRGQRQEEGRARRRSERGTWRRCRAVAGGPPVAKAPPARSRADRGRLLASRCMAAITSPAPCRRFFDVLPCSLAALAHRAGPRAPSLAAAPHSGRALHPTMLRARRKRRRRSRRWASWSPRATPARSRFLQALLDGEVQTAGEQARAASSKDGEGGRRRHRREGRAAARAAREDVVAQQPRAARARRPRSRALKLSSPDRATRLAAAKTLQRRRRRGDAAADRAARWRSETGSGDQGAARR